MRRGLLVVFLVAACSAGGAPSADIVTGTSLPTTVAGDDVVPVTTVAAPSTSVRSPVTATQSPRPSTSAVAPPASESTTSTTHEPLDRGAWFVVWVTAAMPDGFSDLLSDAPGVAVVSEVWVGNAEMVMTRDADGVPVDETVRPFVIPLDLHAIDPAGHDGFVPPEVSRQLRMLGTDEVLLGESSATLRRLGVGSTIVLASGVELTVAGIVPDRWVGLAEVVTTSPDAADLGAVRPRYAVVRFDGERAELEALATALTDRAVRVWAENEVAVLRHADAVRAQVDIKLRFGEFSYRDRGRGRIEVDPEWVAAHIVTLEIPRLGVIRCHRDFAALLEQVMVDVAESDTPDVVTRSSNSGCFNQRFIAGRRDLSRHSWGIAMDINWGNPHDSIRSPVAPALLAAMGAHGITSGHDWVNPDAGHFEWIGEPPFLGSSDG